MSVGEAMDGRAVYYVACKHLDCDYDASTWSVSWSYNVDASQATGRLICFVLCTQQPASNSIITDMAAPSDLPLNGDRMTAVLVTVVIDLHRLLASLTYYLLACSHTTVTPAH